MIIYVESIVLQPKKTLQVGKWLIIIEFPTLQIWLRKGFTEITF